MIARFRFDFGGGIRGFRERQRSSARDGLELVQCSGCTAAPTNMIDSVVKM